MRISCFLPKREPKYPEPDIVILGFRISQSWAMVISFAALIGVAALVILPDLVQRLATISRVAR